MYKRDLKTGLLFLFFVMAFAANCLAIQRVTSIGAREAALSLATVALPGSFSHFHNQAFLTETNNLSASFSYRQPYFIEGYHESALTVACPIPSAVLAIGLTQSNVATYNESNIGISIAKKLTARVSAGILFNYFDLNLPESGQHKGSIQVDGGVGYQHSRRLSLGFHLRNIAFTKTETFQHVLTFPLVVRGGVAYDLSDRILLAMEAIFEEVAGCGLRLGTEFKLLNTFHIRGGISTNPFQHSFGFGYIWNFCQLDFSMVHHELLGFTPMLSFSFNLKR